MTDPGNAGAERIYRFADYVVDAGRREIRRDGEAVELQPKAFDLLVYLIEHRERAVDKDELQSAIWSDVIVTEASLTKAVRRARLAVGDDADRQGVIGTVHGHGYRFVAELTDASRAPQRGTLPPDAPAGPGSLPPPGPPAPKRWPLWLAAAVMALVVGYGSFRRGVETAQQAPVRIAVLPVENQTGDADLDWTRLGLMSVLADGLRNANFRVVDDGDVVRLSSVQQANASTRTAAWLAQTLRQAHGANFLVAARLEKQGDVYRMRTELRGDDRSAGDAMFAGADLLQLARNAATRVAAEMAASQRLPAVGEAISDDPFVNESYARGRALELEGRCTDAKALLSAAMVQQPKLLEPKMFYASCARILGETAIAEKMFRELLQQLDERDARAPATRHLRANVLLRLGILLNRTGRIDESDATYADAEAIARELDDLDLVAHILVNRAYIAEDRSQFALAREHLMRALGLFQEARREIVPGNLYGALANIAIDEGRLDDADRNYQLAVQNFRLVGDRRNEAMMLNNQGLLKREQGKLDDAEALHKASAEIREAIGDRQGLGRVENMLALLYLARGQFDLAMPRIEKSLAIAREGNDRFFEAVTIADRGDIHLAVGRLDLAQRDIDEAVRIFQELGNRAYVLQLSAKRLEIDRRQGRFAKAQRAGVRLLREAQAEKQDVAEIDLLAVLASIARDRGERSIQIGRQVEALERARSVGHQGKVVSTSIALAESYMEDGALSKAEPLLGTLVDAPESYELMRLRAAWADVHGEAVAAATAMLRAKALAGQRWSEADAAALLRYQAIR
ncbi:MAG: tetratricopeptide repeat protein [Steroidobacteraceae bacterium]